jgi:hypothetical protein
MLFWTYININAVSLGGIRVICDSFIQTSHASRPVTVIFFTSNTRNCACNHDVRVRYAMSTTAYTDNIRIRAPCMQVCTLCQLLASDAMREAVGSANVQRGGVPETAMDGEGGRLELVQAAPPMPA